MPSSSISTDQPGVGEQKQHIPTRGLSVWDTPWGLPSARTGVSITNNLLLSPAQIPLAEAPHTHTQPAAIPNGSATPRLRLTVLRHGADPQEEHRAARCAEATHVYTQ